GGHMDTKVAKPAGRRTRRRHDVEFKAQVIEACRQPGVSVAAVALANGLNANMLRKWVRADDEGGVSGKVTGDAGVMPVTGVVPVTVVGHRPGAEIRIDVRRGGTTLQMAWPQDALAGLGPCLRELLR
ncbi:MAG TPA: transposase, partial [Rhodocyclaceae bacterium]|nr:transposase [Rhodocyclaceae bacterium]